MEPADDREGLMVEPIDRAKIEKGTGRSWHDCAELETLGAARLSHREIARVLVERAEVSEWWAQTITVAFEQHIGRRVPGQGSDGRFSASLSRTLAGSPDELRDRWLAVVAPADGFAGAALRASPTTSRTAKRLYWRGKLDDGTSVTVSFERKAPGKTLVAVSHDRLPASSRIGLCAPSGVA
jgi:hypothetical protein